jgi:pilus assembly protein Flp/PilA
MLISFILGYAIGVLATSLLIGLLRAMKQSTGIEDASHAGSQKTSCLSFTSTKEATAMVHSFFGREDGQGLVEYALILVLIAIVVIGILTLLGTKVSQVFSSINSGLA